MRVEQLSDALSLLSDSLLEEVCQDREHPQRRRPAWQRWGALAACLALVLLAGSRMLPGRPQATPVPPESSADGGDGETELPLLTLENGGPTAMGYEGYMAYDIGELVNANPWTPETTPATLPVYRNALVPDEQGQTQRMDFGRMEEVAVEVAAKLALAPSDYTVTDNAPDEEYRQAVTEKFAAVGDTVPEGYFDPTEVVLAADELTITVSRELTARIDFDPPVELPEEYHFTHYATLEEKEKDAQWLAEEYAGLLSDMEEPALNLTGGDRNIYRDQSYDVTFYDAAGDTETRIINYNFNRVAFYCDDDGKLFLAQVFGPDLSRKLGDYPIIGVDAARQLLAEGNYTTSVPYEMPGTEYVRKVELLYRTGTYEQTYLPWYRFLVELPEAEREEDGLKDYGAYYVPAVEGKYISNMPRWDGGFNGGGTTVNSAVPPGSMDGPIAGQK